MQEDKIVKFKNAVGKVIRELRQTKTSLSINKLALEFDFDKGNLSKTERGMYSIQLITAYKIAQALGLKFSDFAKILEDELGKGFTLIDE